MVYIITSFHTVSLNYSKILFFKTLFEEIILLFTRNYDVFTLRNCTIFHDTFYVDILVSTKPN